MSWVSSRGAENSWNRGSSSSNRGSSSNSSSSSSSAVCDCSAPTLFFAPSLLHLLSLQHGCAMELYWYKDATAMLLYMYVTKGFFFYLLLLLLRDPFLLFRFSFPKRENGQKKGLQKDCKDLCVYIPEKGTKKSCEKKPVDDKILFIEGIQISKQIL